MRWLANLAVVGVIVGIVQAAFFLLQQSLESDQIAAALGYSTGRIAFYGFIGAAIGYLVDLLP